ncbi:MAG: CotH kinase family protein [bacterium]
MNYLKKSANLPTMDLLKKRKLKFVIITSSVIVTITIIVSIVFFSLSPLERYFLIDNPLGKSLILPTWHSLRKVVNIVHFPYWFQKSQLKTFYLELSRADLKEMNDHLPIDKETGDYLRMTDEYKFFVKGNFQSKNYNEKDYSYNGEIKIRYRGLTNTNWDAQQKAFMIDFPEQNLFEGKKTVNLFLPWDRSYFMEPLNIYRGKKFGLKAPEAEFVRLNLNSIDNGIYLAIEHWSKEWLEKNDMYDFGNILSNKDQQAGLVAAPLFSEERLGDWKSYTAQSEEGPFEELTALIRLVEKADDEEFAQKIGNLIDLEKFYNYILVNMLAGSNHQSDEENVVLLFRPETGKFEPLLWDVNIYPLGDDFYLENNRLIRRILSVPEFFAEYNRLLASYTKNDQNLKDDLAYYDDLYKKLQKEFYKDQAKLDTDLAFDNRIKEIRQLIISNLEKAKKMAETESYPSSLSIKGGTKGLNFDGSFKYFNEISKDINEFVSLNPYFRKINATTLSLKRGIYVFSKTVIIPKGLNLIIEPGARLYFAPETSFVSYSPVSAQGTAHAPIVMAGLYPGGKPWGGFAVINTEGEKSFFNYLNVGGGSQDLINGTVLTSQFSLNNADAEVKNSIFENGRSDDGFHVLLGSVLIQNNIFRNNSADGIDLDYAKSAIIEENYFLNNGVTDSNGDAVDLSGMRDVLVKNNTVIGCGDKGVSVGERSFPNIENNKISKCTIGIASKDLSKATIKNNTITDNKTGIEAYQKKQVWGGATAILIDNILQNNETDFYQDQFSKIEIQK